MLRIAGESQRGQLGVEAQTICTHDGSDVESRPPARAVESKDGNPYGGGVGEIVDAREESALVLRESCLTEDGGGVDGDHSDADELLHDLEVDSKPDSTTDAAEAQRK